MTGLETDHLIIEKFRNSPTQGREIQRVISNYADAAKIGRKIAEEARDKSRESSASNSPMSVSAASPQSYLQRNVHEQDTGK